MSELRLGLILDSVLTLGPPRMEVSCNQLGLIVGLSMACIPLYVILHHHGQAWSSASPRGQWRTGKNGENWLQDHLWCPQ